MTSKTSQTKAPQFGNRGARKLTALAAALGLSLLCLPELNAQTVIGYLQQQTGDSIPVSPRVTNLGNCPPITFNLIKAVQQNEVLCGFGPFTLPGYAGSVYVGFSGDIPQLSWAHNKDVENQSTSNSSYRWGSDTDEISLYNASADTVNYTISFYFSGPAPSASDLFLVVAGLESGTVATVSGIIGPWPATGAATLSAQNGGEYTIPGDLLWCNSVCSGTSPTTLIASATGTSLTFSSGYTGLSPLTDPRNTGWDLYQPNSTGLGVLSLDVQQLGGDGIAVTLGYPVCTTLIGTDLDSRSNYQMYDISTATGTAGFPKIIGPYWELAFSPISAEGVLYALVGNTLYSVNPGSGVPAKLSSLTSPINGSNGIALPALAADPTNSSVLYGENNGSLFTVSPTGTVTNICSVPGPIAFDSAGNLFVVDTYSNAVLQVNKTTCVVTNQVTLSGLIRWSAYSQLAIDPATGQAYYAEGGYLYKLDLTTGSLTSPVQVTGTEDNGNLFSLTFTVGACPANSPL